MSTIATYKKQITDNFMANTTIADAYGFEAGADFDATFSSVSIESILFYIIAVFAKIIGDALDTFESEQDAAIEEAEIATDRWWYNKVMAYIFGASLVYDSTTFAYTLSSDSTTTLVAYCAIRQKINSSNVTYIEVMCAKSSYAVLTDTEKIALTEYLTRVKPAGVIFVLESNTPDIIYFPKTDSAAGIQIYYDPMLLDGTGLLLSDNSTYPVNEAIANYLAGIVYGGKLNITKLIDAIQAAPGVVDVKVNTCKQHRYTDVSGVGQTITTTVDLAAGVGTFSISDTNYVSNIGYEPQSELQ